MIRAFSLVLVAAATASAGPLPASYSAIDAKQTMWTSPAMSLANADKEWRALVGKPGLVPVIVEDKPEPPEVEETPPKPLSLAAARASLAAKRKARQAMIEKVLAAHPEVPAAEARVARTQWTTWEKARATATITADDRKTAADLIAADAKGDDLGGKPKQYYVLVYQGSVDSVVAQYSAREEEVTGSELASVLAAWNRQYGARLYAWDGYQWTFDVPHPPTKLPELRALAGDFAFACPFERGGRGQIAELEPPGELMARLEQKRWVCYWFIE